MKNIYIILLLNIIGAQSIDVTFRYVKKPTDNFVRVFIPGTMPSGSSNDWGPNSDGIISPNAPSQMIYNQNTDSYEKSYSLSVGNQEFYKVHYHFNQSGSENSWVPDPLNPNVTADEWTNSILEVTDPLFFQPARHLDEQGLVDGLSLGVFTSMSLDSIRYSIGEELESTSGYTLENGVFYVSLDPPRSLYESYKIEAFINGQTYTAYDQPALDVVEEPKPDNIVMGPNWINGTMYLAIYAPYQPVVQVIITEPGVTGLASDAIVLKKDPNAEYIWWTELSLPIGTYDYEYLLVDGSRLADPLARRIVDGKTRIEIGPGGVSTADDYDWQSTNYSRPGLENMVIYELHIDDFAAEGSGMGTFQDLENKLDYLHSIGVNAIELMPVYANNWSHSWGYDPIHHLALKELYGTPFDFKRLVDQAHLRGIAVLLDQVWNHIGSSGPLWRIQPDYGLNPYIKVWTETNLNEEQESWGQQDLDHFNPKTVEYVNQVNKIFVDEYRIDGFRFDAGRYIGWNFNQPELGLLAWTSELYEHDPSVIQTVEYLPSDPWLIDNTNIHSSWHDSFHDRTKNDVHNQYVSTLDIMRQMVQLHEYSSWDTPYSHFTQAVKYMISHDEQSVIQEMVEFAGYSLSEARERDRFYATVLFTSMGIPMLWQGQEFGFKSGWLDENGNGNWDEEKLDYRPIDWSLLDTDAGQEHLEHYKKLIALRKTNPAFSKGTFYDIYRYTQENVIVYGYKDERPEGNDDQVVVIANFSGNNETITNVPFLSSGQWYNALDSENDLYTADGNYGQYFIQSKHAVVYTNNEYQLDVTGDESELPQDFQILKAYPNPFNAKVTFEVVASKNTLGELTIFDISGKKIKSLKNINIQSGENNLSWEGRDDKGFSVSTGIYFISFKSDLGNQNQKILLVK